LLERGDHRVLLALVDLARVRLNALVGGRPGGVVAGDVDVFAGRCLIHLEERFEYTTGKGVLSEPTSTS